MPAFCRILAFSQRNDYQSINYIIFVNMCYFLENAVLEKIYK
jgi:hypothetical protein